MLLACFFVGYINLGIFIISDVCTVYSVDVLSKGCMSQYGICLVQRHLPDLRKHIYLKFTAYDRRLGEVGNYTVTTSAKKKKKKTGL